MVRELGYSVNGASRATNIPRSTLRTALDKLLQPSKRKPKRDEQKKCTQYSTTTSTSNPGPREQKEVPPPSTDKPVEQLEMEAPVMDMPVMEEPSDPMEPEVVPPPSDRESTSVEEEPLAKETVVKSN